MAKKIREGSEVSTEETVANNDAIRWRIWFHGMALVHHTLIYVKSATLDFSKISDKRLQDLKQYGPCYFTFWNLTFQFVYLLMSLAYDYAETNAKTKSRFWKRLKIYIDLVFFGAVYPCGLFVTIAFWTFYAIDREMVFPRVYDECLPYWYNLSIHLWTILVPALELTLGAKKVRDKRSEVRLLWAIELAYVIVYHVSYLLGGRWLYPVHNTLSTLQKIFFQIFVSLFIRLIYETQYFLRDGVKFSSLSIFYRLDKFCTKCV